MHQSRDVFLFNHCLEEIREMAAKRNEKKEDLNIDLSKEDKALVDKFIAGEIEHDSLSFDAKMYCTLQSMAEQRKDPFLYSDLTDSLELETWIPEEALMRLAGIDPHAAIFEWSYENFMGAEIHQPKIRHAMCFSDTGDLYDYPVTDDFELGPSELRRMIRDAQKNGGTEQDINKLQRDLNEVERWSNDETSQYKTQTLSLRATMLGVLKKRWDSGDHDVTQRHSPVFFVRWAEKRGFEVEWAEWARKNQLLPEGQAAETPPYFDADSEDYPELLHIAVAAWEHARKSTGRTPKQRILSYLVERYPALKEAPREAIATVANWQKGGGRPRTGG